MAIEKQDTTQKIMALIAEKLNIDQSMVKAEVMLQDLGADSLDMVEIIMKLEEQFSIEINDEEAEKLTNVQEVINYVHVLRTK